MYGETPLDRAEYALLLNLKWRNSPQLGGTPEKIGYEVCFTDALGFVRYSDQVAIDAAKGIDLVEVSPLFIDFPSDKANTIPFERRYARPWVKTYIETLAQDLHEFLAREHRGQEVPRLRMGSLVRSEVDQRRLRSTANCSTEICSTHLTGATIDISNNSNYV